MKIQLSKILRDGKDFINEFQYRNYVYNRERSPDIPVKHYRIFYSEQTLETFEKQYQREKAEMIERRQNGLEKSN